MSTLQFDNWKHRAASSSLLSSSLQVSSYAGPSIPAGVLDAQITSPQAEWAAEAIVNLRHVVAGICCALIIEGGFAFAVYSVWHFMRLWHLW